MADTDAYSSPAGRDAADHAMTAGSRPTWSVADSAVCRWCSEPIMLGIWLGREHWWAARAGVGMCCPSRQAPPDPESSVTRLHEPVADEEELAASPSRPSALNGPYDRDGGEG